MGKERKKKTITRGEKRKIARGKIRTKYFRYLRGGRGNIFSSKLYGKYLGKKHHFGKKGRVKKNILYGENIYPWWEY